MLEAPRSRTRAGARRVLRSIVLAAWVAIGLVALGPAALARDAGAPPRDSAADASFEWSGARDACPHGPLAAKAPARPRLQPRGDVPAGRSAAAASSLALDARSIRSPGSPRRCGRHTHLRLGVLLI